MHQISNNALGFPRFSPLSPERLDFYRRIVSRTGVLSAGEGKELLDEIDRLKRASSTSANAPAPHSRTCLPVIGHVEEGCRVVFEPSQEDSSS